MSRVLIFEPSLSGHRALYVSVLAAELLRLGAPLTLAVPDDALDRPEGQAFLSPILPQCDHHPLAPLAASLSVQAHAKARLSLLEASVKQTAADHCFVPYADGLAQAWGISWRPGTRLPAGTQLEGLMMRGGFAYPAASWTKKLKNEVSYWLQRRSPWTRLHQLDPLAYREIVKRTGDTRANLLIPEIIDTLPSTPQREARHALGLSADRFLIACPGSVNESKGCDRLLDAVLTLREPEVQLVLFGKHSPKMQRQVAALGSDQRLISVDRFASEQEFGWLFSAADAIAVCYPRHVGSSSILLRAIKANKPVIASNWGWVGWATETFQLGRTCEASCSESIAAAIESTIEQAEPANPEFAKLLLQYHSRENHLAHWTALYRQQNGLDTSNLLNFDTVLDRVLAD